MKAERNESEWRMKSVSKTMAAAGVCHGNGGMAWRNGNGGQLWRNGVAKQIIGEICNNQHGESAA